MIEPRKILSFYVIDCTCDFLNVIVHGRFLLHTQQRVEIARIVIVVVDE